MQKKVKEETAVPRGRGRPKKEQPDADTRQLILRAATQEFREQGYGGASVANICKRAQIANGTFYIHFPDKAQLYGELIGGTFARLAEALVKAQVENAGLGAEELERRDVEIIVNFAESNRDTLLVAFNERALAPSEEASLIDMFASQRAADFRRGRLTGRFRADVNPVITAYAETGLIAEVLRWWLQNPRAISKAKLIEELLALKLRLSQPERAGRP
ncbi:TetR/AcrR family transcriptional regulator [Ramlibacter henchirensis]|uniref:TetR/AcrR family transcriptional regulator n=1 Tax=Ramlibacter henchirensis TaxID=204072 RepID=A0A4Z0C6C8_9BURK|nr:TetR/AcrR family transcriptional regulator [Ramlibacter henchirensis]TFZ05928.1 TetR/AcrR family transcriptional regulator [Ramlibacter henchirensis]